MDTRKKKKLIIQVGLFLAIMVFTIWFVFRDEEVEAVLTAMKQMSFAHLLLAVAVALFYVSMEGVMIWYLLRSIDGTGSLFSCISCAFIGFLFSGITPSATGGQPMQLYYLKRDGNSWSLSSVVLMTVALMYKLVLVIFGGGILLFWRVPLRGYLGGGYYRLFLLGLTLNTLLVVGLLMVMFTPSVIRMMISKVEWLAVRLHLIKKKGSKQARLDHFMENYQNALSFLKEHKGKMLAVLLGTVVQRTAVFALTYIVYRGMGLSGATLTTIMWLQAAVYIAVDMLPIPGAQGITEAMYRRAFLDIFTAGHVTASICISRGVSFYLMICVGLIVMLYQFCIKKEK
ncbi:MAG: lysylphosphatidylglycerol synthase transmembrane domain-containing protein [Lachnospiraceae bacterium]